MLHVGLVLGHGAAERGGEMSGRAGGRRGGGGGRWLGHAQDPRTHNVDDALGVPVTGILGVDGELSHVGEGLVPMARWLGEARVRQVERAFL